MAYFSNGTEGMAYQDQYCDKCIHNDNCAVWDAHQIHNYDEANNDQSILHDLIPMVGLWPSKCLMFVSKHNLVYINLPKGYKIKETAKRQAKKGEFYLDGHCPLLWLSDDVTKLEYFILEAS